MARVPHNVLPNHDLAVAVPSLAIVDLSSGIPKKRSPQACNLSRRGSATTSKSDMRRSFWRRSYRIMTSNYIESNK